MIFDLDGTLVNFALDIKSVRQEAVKEIQKRGITINNYTNLNVYSMLEILRSYADERTFFSLKKSIWKIVEKYELIATNKVNIQPDALQILTFIKKIGLKLAIVTNNGRKATSIVIRKFRLDDFFDLVVTREDVEKLKPDRWSIQKAVKILGIESKEAIYIGDSVIDVLAARKAKTISIAIPTGISSISELVKTKPDYIIGSLQDMKVLLKFFSHN